MRSVIAKRVFTISLLTSAVFISLPSNSAFAEESAPTPAVSQNAPGHESGESVNREPADHIREEHRGFEGTEVFMLGGAAVIAIGLAFLAGRKSRRNK
jgi:hypothetical protein